MPKQPDTSDDISAMPAAALWLAILLALPFWILSLLFVIPQQFFPQPVALAYLLAYCALCLTFIGGIRWGANLGPGDEQRRAMDYCGAVTPIVVGWLAVFSPPVIGFSLLVAAFMLQTLWDLMAVKSARLPVWFGNWRILLSALAVAAVGLVLARLILG